jgi:hypothetical protein
MNCGPAEDICRYCAGCVCGVWIICTGWDWIWGCCWITIFAVGWTDVCGTHIKYWDDELVGKELKAGIWLITVGWIVVDGEQI